jgi:hypothetical protein
MIDSPSFNLYAEKLTEVRAPRAGDIVLTKSAYLGKDIQYEMLFEKQGVVLVKIMKISAAESTGGNGGER